MTARLRLVRDPIHGDVPVGPIQAAILDTPIMQRLRYIKQNGLLHFVFPGAVHTRFAHSLGTMHVAGRVFRSLFPTYKAGEPHNTTDSSVRYLGEVFTTAALLHDCGHGAFSHSIEHVDIAGRPLLLTLPEYAEEWSTPEVDLKGWCDEQLNRGHLQLEERTSHEEIGLLLIGRIARHDKVSQAISDSLNTEPSAFLDDVRALICPTLTVSQTFAESAYSVTGDIGGVEEIPADERSDHLKTALSTLVSGTLDVDRMDYLIRDSKHTGAIYGMYDIDVITNALTLCVGESGGATLGIGLFQRACQAVDDFLWSRYQFFSQVLNHKTNVILNALLAQALPEAMASSSVGIGHPRSFEDYVEFTDDWVMSSVFSSSLRDSGSSRRMYHRALVGRDLPLYLGRIDVTDASEAERISKREEARALHAKRVGVPQDDVESWSSHSALIKGGGLPFLIQKDKVTKRPIVLNPLDDDGYQVPRWVTDGKLPATVTHEHFFVDRLLVGA